MAIIINLIILLICASSALAQDFTIVKETIRLHTAIEAVAPIFGVGDLNCAVNPPTARIDFKPEATAQQQTNAANALASFDCSAGAQTTFENTQARTSAKDLLDNSKIDRDKLIRAIALITMDELNILRSWLAAFKAEVAAATTLADLKSRVATLPNTPDRNASQIITAIKNKIDSGTVD